MCLTWSETLMTVFLAPWFTYVGLSFHGKTKEVNHKCKIPVLLKNMFDVKKLDAHTVFKR